MSCDCSDYPPIELDRRSINRRIKQSPKIRKRLSLVAENPELRLYLFRCPVCNQLWQSGWEWNFKAQEYLFQVPPIEVEDWQREPYQQPAAMLIYSASMQNFFDRWKPEPGDTPCRADGCTSRAARLSVFCREHHIEMLQRDEQLPHKPTGRIFPPYVIESPDSA